MKIIKVVKNLSYNQVKSHIFRYKLDTENTSNYIISDWIYEAKYIIMKTIKYTVGEVKSFLEW